MSGDRYVSLPLARSDGAADGRYVSLALRSDAPPATLIPDGLFAGAFGAALIATLQGTGFDSQAFGTAFIAFADRTVNATGLAQFAAGTATVEIDSGIKPAPWIVQTAVGAHTVQLSRREVVLTGVQAPGSGNHAVTHWLQRADIAGRGPGPSAPPAPVVTDSPRTLTVPWSYMTAIGAHLVGFDREIAAGGLPSLALGVVEVRDNTQQVFADGLPPIAPPEPTGYFLVRTLRPAGLRSVTNDERYGEPLVNNEDQQATLFDAWERERIWAVPMPAVNWWDRPVKPIGLWAGEVETRLSVSIPSPPARPDGIAPGDIGTAFVSHEHRTLEPPGEVLGRFGAHVAYNDARVLQPRGMDASAFGAAAVRNDLRFVAPVTSNDTHTVFGTAFVADAERTLLQGTEWSLRTYFGAATVSLWENYISTDGVHQSAVGGHYAERKQNLVLPSGQWMGATGAATARRISIDPEGKHAFEAGQPRITRDPEYLSAIAWQSDVHGLGNVYHRNRTVTQTNAHAAPPVPLTHSIRNETPEPPGERTILVTGHHHVAFGAATVRANTIRPDGSQMTGVGSPALTGTGISPLSVPPPGFNEGGQVGFPSIPGEQVASPGTVDESAVPEPALSPHWIFGPIGLGDGHQIDFFTHGNSQRPNFGAVSVSNQVRGLSGVGDIAAPGGGSTHEISNIERTIQLAGIKSWRIGIAKIPQGIPVETIGSEMSLFGTLEVSYATPEDRTLQVSAVGAGTVGAHEAQHQHRTLALGSGISGVAWGTAWVDRAVRTIDTQGPDTAEFGDAWSSYRVRSITGEGWDSAETANAPGETRWRMRVSRGPAPATPAMLVTGLDAGAHGVTNVSNHERSIDVGSIWPPQAPVPSPIARGQNDVSVHGILASLDHLVVGAPAMWATGDPLVPFAVEMFAAGAARVGSVASPESLDSGATGTASMVRPLDPAGDLFSALGAHLVAHGDGVHVCGQLLRGIRPSAAHFLAIGAPSVAHD